MEKKKKSYIQRKGLPRLFSGKDQPANAGDNGSIPGLGRSPGGWNWPHTPVFLPGIPWTEEPGRLQCVGLQRADHDLATEQK